MINHPFSKSTDMTQIVLRELAIADKGLVTANVELINFLKDYNLTLTGSLLYQISDSEAKFTFSDVDLIMYYRYMPDTFGFVKRAKEMLPVWQIELLPNSSYTETGDMPFVTDVVRFKYFDAQFDLQIMHKRFEFAKSLADELACTVKMHKLPKSEFRKKYNSLLMTIYSRCKES